MTREGTRLPNSGYQGTLELPWYPGVPQGSYGRRLFKGLSTCCPACRTGQAAQMQAEGARGSSWWYPRGRRAEDTRRRGVTRPSMPHALHVHRGIGRETRQPTLAQSMVINKSLPCEILRYVLGDSVG
jgi:hypothetical protein